MHFDSSALLTTGFLKYHWIMSVLYWFYLLGLVIWFVGVGAAIYHVFRYRIPGDYTTTSLWIFLSVSAVVFLVTIFYISGIDWGAI